MTVLAVGILPFFLTLPRNEYLTVSANLISSLASLTTMLIALLLYKKYGIERSVIDKQTEIVVKLLYILKELTFGYEGSDGTMLLLGLDSVCYHFWKKYKYRKLLFDYGYVQGLTEIQNIAKDVFLPVEIAKTFVPLTFHSITPVKDKQNYFKVITPGGYCNKKITYTHGLLNETEITLEDFINMWKTVIQSATNWLKKHSEMPVNLNFEIE